jgi:chromosome segregation ATPase
MELSPELVQLIETIGVPGVLIVVMLFVLRRQSSALAKQSEIIAQRAKQMDEERVKDKDELDKQLERSQAQSQKATELAVGILRDALAATDKRLEANNRRLEAIIAERDKLKLEAENTKRRIDEIEAKLSHALKEIKVKDDRIHTIEASEQVAVSTLKVERQKWEKREGELLEKIRELELQITALTARVTGLEAADGIKTDKLKKIETGLLVDPASKDKAA